MNKEKLEEEIEHIITYSFSRSQGPGGQNVNKVNTKVTARLNITELTELSEVEQEQIKNQLAQRINRNNEVIIQVQETRNQSRNKAIALENMIQLIAACFKVKRKRHKTKPSTAAVESRLQLKKQQSQKKQQRRWTY